MVIAKGRVDDDRVPKIEGEKRENAGGLGGGGRDSRQRERRLGAKLQVGRLF